MRDLVRLLVLLVLSHVAFVGIRITTSLYSLQALEFSPAMNGALMALFGLVPMFFAVGTGRLVDRIGFRKPMMVGSVTLICGSLMVVALPVAATLYVAAMVMSSGFMLFQIGLQNVIGHMGRPEDRAINFSWLALAFSISALIAPLASGFGIDTIGHRWTFAGFAIAAIVSFVALVAGAVPLPDHTPAPQAPGPRHFMDLLSGKRLRHVYIVTGLTAVAWELFVFVVPLYGQSINLSASRIGLILGVFAAATVLVRLAMPFVSRRLTPWQVLLVALVVAGCGYVAFPLVHSVPVLMALAFCLGLALGTSQPMVLALLYTHTPPGRIGEGIGLRQMFVNTAQTTVPLFFGAAGAAVGMLPVFWVLGAAIFAGAWGVRKGGRS